MFILEIVKYFTASLEVLTFPTLPSFSPQILIRDHEDLSQALFSDVIECIGGFCANVSLTKQAVSLDPETAWGKMAGNSQKTMVESAFDGDQEMEVQRHHLAHVRAEDIDCIASHGGM